MARKNRTNAQSPQAFGGPPPDDATEVTVRSGRGLLPIDDETNFGDANKGSELEQALLEVDPRELARKMARRKRDLKPTPTKRQAPSRRLPVELPEDQPTTLGPATDGPQESPITLEDPAALARRLAEEAKARLEPETTSPPRTARRSRLTQRRTSRVRTDAPAEPRRKAPRSPVTRQATRPPAPPRTPSEDPAALARRLAREAKEKLGQTAEPAQPRQAATRPVPTPKPAPPRRKPKGVEMPPPEAPTAVMAPLEAPPEPPKKKSLAERAPRRKPPVSAAEQARKLSAEPAPQRKVEPTASRKMTFTPPPEPAPRDAQPLSPSVSRLAALLPGCTILTEHPVQQVNVFLALWEAHQARALRNGRLPLAATATLLLEQARKGRPLIAARIRHADTEWAAFLAADDHSLLGIVEMPEIYLAGIK